MIKFVVIKLATNNWCVVCNNDIDKNNRLKVGRKPISSYHKSHEEAETEREKIEQKFGDVAHVSNPN